MTKNSHIGDLIKSVKNGATFYFILFITQYNLFVQVIQNV